MVLIIYLFMDLVINKLEKKRCCNGYTFKIQPSSKSTRDKNLPVFKIYPIKIRPVKFENRLLIESKG